jgi:hypothetical protein
VEKKATLAILKYIKKALQNTKVISEEETIYEFKI